MAILIICRNKPDTGDDRTVVNVEGCFSSALCRMLDLAVNLARHRISRRSAKIQKESEYVHGNRLPRIIEEPFL